MKRILLFSFFSLISTTLIFSQLSISNNNTDYTINFDSSISGVNSGSFMGSGFATNPSSGQLDADAWATTGLSDGSKDFGVNNTSGDHARGSNNGGVTTGGLYGFDVGGGNRALAIQATGGDWTPGTLTLKIVNNSGSSITDMTIDYNIYVRNDKNRANSFNLSMSYNNSNYSGISSANYTSPQAATGTSWIINPKSVILSGLSIAPGEDFYIRWAGSDAGGSGSRDEFALDDIVIGVSGATNGCTEPLVQASNLNFGTVTNNSIQASYTISSADKFLVVQSLSSSLGGNPADGNQYSIGSNIGNGEVIQYSNSNSINSLGLNASTEYFYFIYAANDNCTGGPDYLTSNPLTGSISTTGGGTNYYDGIGSETCANLKTALHNLIDNHTEVSYNSLWTHYQTTDDHLNDSGTEVIVWDMYSDNPYSSENEFTFVAEQCGSYQGEGDCYNREHSFPKSWWGGGTSVPQYTDLFTVVPVDGWINGIRNNNPYGEIQAGTETHITNNGSALGSSSITIPGYSGSVFEPIDAYKGDLARGYFYMMTRYEDGIASWENFTSESDAVLDGTSYPGFEQWALDMLINWHNIDPVDTKELERNEAIYGIQGNRNPFIDNPDYVNLIWGSCGTSDTEAPTTPSNLVASNTSDSTTDLSWTASTDNVAVTGYDIYQNGIYLTSSASNNFNVTGLTANTNYDYYVEAYDAAGNISGSSNVVSITTNAGADTQAPTIPSNLTAANTTETTTDLSWTASSDNVGVTGYNIYQNGNYLTSSTNNNYNVSGLSADTNYDFYVQAYDAAGNVSGNSNTVSITTDAGADTQAPSNPTSLVASNTTETTTDLSWTASTDNVGVTGYDIYQDGSYLVSSTSNSYNVTGLTADTNYDFYVRAYDAAGNISGNSNTVSITTDAPPSNNEILGSYFETGWDGWQDGGNDCSRYSGSNSPEGSFSIKLRDNSGVSSSMTSPVMDLTGFTSVNVEFSFRGSSMENNEDFWLRYYDGNNWQTVETYAKGPDFQNNINYTVNVTINSSNYNFPSDAQIRFQCDASANNDRMYIDAVIVTGETTSGYIIPTVQEETLSAVNTSIDIQEEESFEIEIEEEVSIQLDESFEIYPNPTNGMLNIKWETQSKELREILVFDYLGRQVESFEIQSGETSQRDLSHLNDGLYIFRFKMSDNTIQTKRIYLVR